MSRAATSLLLALLAALLASAPAPAQNRPGQRPVAPLQRDAQGLIQLDFKDMELAQVIDQIAEITGKNFIYDDRVRGRITIVSPSPVTVDQAYAVFESVLQVKGFTTVSGPGGVYKIIPIRDAKESSIETVKDGRTSPNRDLFVTRLIPLRYIDAEAITNTVKPLISKDAAMVAYPPTNTIILTDTQANIRRLLSILEAIDVKTYKEELAVIRIFHADAGTLGEQISDIYGAQIEGTASRRTTRRSRRTRATVEVSAEASERSKVRIITDERTNSLIVLASRSQLEDIRGLVRKLDVPITGGGSIRVYYLRHADAEELSQTLSGLVGAGGGAPTGPGRTGAAATATAQALRAAVTELEEGVNLTADPATNSLIIRGSKEAYETLRGVIEQLDIPRPQVLVEALIMEVNVTDNSDLGINSLVKINEGIDIVFSSVTDPDTAALLGAAVTATGFPAAPFVANARSGGENGDTVIQAIIRASATNGDTNIVSAPHILTSDNEEAEIRIGNNIPIPTSRVESAAGATDAGLSTSVNIERQDVGVTLRVTPQISEGDTLRLRIFQEITAVDENLTQSTGSAEEVGVALTNRRVENTVVVSNGETVVVGGLVSDQVIESVDKVPFLGDIPVLGWLFKTRTEQISKQNLLVFLTPNIVRSADELEAETIRKREEFRARAGKGVQLSKKERRQAAELGLLPSEYSGRNPMRRVLLEHAERYPLARMAAIEAERQSRLEVMETAAALESATRYQVSATGFGDVDEASEVLTELIDAGFDGTLESLQRGGRIEIELQMTPVNDLRQARTLADILRRSYQLEPVLQVLEPPSVEEGLVSEPEEPAPEDLEPQEEAIP